MKSQFKLVGKSLKINKIHKYSLKEADKLKKIFFKVNLWTHHSEIMQQQR